MSVSCSLLFIVGAFIHGALVARSLYALGPLRVHSLFTVGLSFERSTVISMCVTDPRLTVRPIYLFTLDAAKVYIGRSHGSPIVQFVVRSLPIQSSPLVHSQYTQPVCRE